MKKLIKKLIFFLKSKISNEFKFIFICDVTKFTTNKKNSNMQLTFV